METAPSFTVAAHVPQRLIVLLLVLFAAIVHLPYEYGNTYGEQDSARLASDALISEKSGVRSIGLSDYRYFTSAGYIFFLERMAAAARVSGVPLPTIMNAAASAIVILTIVPMFLLFRTVIGVKGAVFAALYMQLIPAFWFSGLYGFPTIHALFFVSIALYAGDAMWRQPAGRRRTMYAVAAGLAALAAMLMKADIWVLSGAASIGLTYNRFGLRLKPLLLTSALYAVPVLAGAAAGYASLQNAPAPQQYAEDWNETYSPASKIMPANMAPTPRQATGLIVMSLGYLTGVLFVAAIGVMLARQQYRLALVLVSWVLLTIFFWSWRPGDSSRHHAPGSIPTAIAVGYVLANLRARFAVPLLLATIAVNYYRYPATASTVHTSGRLYESGELARAHAQSFERQAAEFLAIRDCNSVVIGSSAAPYLEVRFLESAQTLRATDGYRNYIPTREFAYALNGRNCRLIFARANGLDVIRTRDSLRSLGAVYSIDYDLTTGRPQPGALSVYRAPVAH